MIYNDFPILENELYNELHSHYQTISNLNTSTLIIKISNELSFCTNACLHLKNTLNPKINKALTSSYNTLNKLCCNYRSTFKLNQTQSCSVTSVNIFSFFERICTLIQQINLWSELENQKNYKTFATKTNNDLINILIELSASFASSNIIFFKHM